MMADPFHNFQLISRLVSLAPDPRKKEVASLMNQFALVQQLNKYLWGVVQSESALFDMAGRSYRHPDGYDSLCVFEGPFEEQLSIRLWREDNEFISDDVSDTCSAVLFGELTSQVYTPGDGESFSKYKLAPDSFELEPDGTEELGLPALFRYESGLILSTSSSDLRRNIRSDNKSVATLIVSGAPTQKTRTLYSATPTTAEEFAPSRMNVKNLENRLKFVLMQLDSAPIPSRRLPSF